MYLKTTQNQSYHEIACTKTNIHTDILRGREDNDLPLAVNCHNRGQEKHLQRRNTFLCEHDLAVVIHNKYI